MASASVDQELWNIFTFYTLNGNPLDPEHMRATQFVKFARDVGVIGPHAVGTPTAPLTEADVNVAYASEVTRAHRTGSIKRMNYNDFLTASMKLAEKVYPHARSVDEAFQLMLMHNVLPKAWRRSVESVDEVLGDEDVGRLGAYFADALEQIFQFYATAANIREGAVAAPGAAAASPLRTAASTGALLRPGSSSGLVRTGSRAGGMGLGSGNSMKAAIGYGEFLKFASDFDLSNSVLLSTRELGDIYLSSIKAVEPDAVLRKLTYAEFWESLVRCALKAYSKISHSTALDRLRGLFLYMWRAITRSVPRAFTERRNLSTYAGDLLSGAMLFNKRFTAMWAEDGYRDYLTPPSAREESGKAVLARITKVGTEEAGALHRALTFSGGMMAGAGGASFRFDDGAGGGGAGAGAGGAERRGESPLPPSFATDAARGWGGGAGAAAGAGGAAPPPPAGPRPADAARSFRAGM